MKKILNSIQAKLFFTVVSVVLMTILFLVIVNSVVFEAYYYYHIKNHLVSSYEKIANETENRAAIIKNLSQIENIDIELTNEDNNMVLSTKDDFIKEFASIPSVNYEVKYSIFNQDEVVYNKNNAMICKIIDKVTGVNVILLKGKLDDGYVYIIKPISIVEESIKISNRSIWTIAVFSVTISAVAVMLITVKFAKPISELNELAKGMSNLDFSKKYTMHNTDDELNQLGMSINVLSSTLEQKIKELEKHNMQLERDIEEKSKIDEMRKQFISDVSHELKTPIALIQGYAEGLLENVNSDEESKNFYAEVIVDESNKMDGLVKKLLELMKLENEDSKFNDTTFDIVELIRNTIKKYNIQLEEDSIKVLFDNEDPIFVYADDFYIEEVFSNYFINAIKNNKEIDNKKEIRITINENKDNGKYRIAVFNTGDNISNENIEKIWNRFYKADKSRNREKGGHGIGLSIVKAIMTRYKSDYGVNNLENGVEFYFDIDKSNN